ncbi:UvrD-helicase domain-containing protein [Nannocystaceae bacterium ST9]
MTSRVELHDDQHEFGPIFDPRRSVVLVASAGTGKTWRLVRRYLWIVAGARPGTREPWATPDQVVAVTFTRAAAAQMRARLFAALTGEHAGLDADDDPVLARIAALRSHAERLNLAERLAAAPIGTLHSYCARLLAEFPELGGVPPDARALEPAEQSLELDAFVAGWIDRAIDEGGHVGHRRVLELLRLHPLRFVRGELRAMVDDRDPPAAGWADPPGAALTDRHAPGPVHADDLLRARELFVRTQWREFLAVLQPAMAGVWQFCVLELQRKPNSARLRELGEALTRIFQRHLPEPDLASVANDIDELRRIRPHRELGQIANLHHHLRDMIRVAGTRRERLVLPDPVRSRSREHAEHLARWIELATWVRRDWAESLRGRALLRYDDLEQLALDLLAHPRARAHLRGRHRHLLVDEYQDISPIQAEILDRLAEACGEQDTKLFYVGDPKQSIYRFRGADPQVFARAEALHRDSILALGENRRSSPTLARFFDALFPVLFSGRMPSAATRPPELARLLEIPDHAEVRWDGPIVALRERDELEGLAVDLLIRDARRMGEPTPELAGEAARVAARVRGLLADPRLRARDVAILIPRWNLAEDHRIALEAQGIAADLAGGRGLLLLAEVRDLINLLRSWADEHDDLAALGVLRGPAMAISDLGLYVLARWPGVDRRIAEADPDLPEFAAIDEVWEPWALDEGTRARPMHVLLRHARLDPERALAALDSAGVLAPEARESARELLIADARALEHGRDRLRAIERHAGGRASGDLLAEVIAEFRLEAHWLASTRERRAVANAWRFVEHVRLLESEGPDLQRLATWLDAGAEPAPEGLISPDADAVTITTWHGSKGKEWPVVIVAGLGEYREAGARTSWSRAGVPTLPALDPVHGEVLPVPRIRGPHHGFWAEPDPLHEPCANMLAPLEAAEAKRLLYVALTRARDRLVLSGETDARSFVHWDDKPWLGLDYRASVDPLLGEPKPFYLCKRPLELLITALDLPAAGVMRPRAGAWSLAHVQVIEDAMLLSGLARASEVPIVDAPAPEPELAPEPEPEPEPLKRALPPLLLSGPVQLDFESFLRRPTAIEIVEPTPTSSPTKPIPEPPSDPVMRWRAGSALTTWQPSAGRSPWPVSELEWDMPLPARQPILLDDEDPRRLGELFHAAMQAWDFVGDPPTGSRLAERVTIHFGQRDAADQRRLTQWLSRCVERFAESELLPELRAARARNQLFHEVDLDALVRESPRLDRISGRLDLLWRDDAGLWNVLDYKASHKVRSVAQMQDLQWEYGPQLLLYRKALERWRPRGEMLFLGRFGLWLATAGKAMWVRSFG